MNKLKMKMPEEVKQFFVQCGIKGGSVTSDKKAAAVRKNGCAPCKPGKQRGRPSKKKLGGTGIQGINE